MVAFFCSGAFFRVRFLLAFLLAEMTRLTAGDGREIKKGIKKESPDEMGDSRGNAILEESPFDPAGDHSFGKFRDSNFS